KARSARYEKEAAIENRSRQSKGFPLSGRANEALLCEAFPSLRPLSWAGRDSRWYRRSTSRGKAHRSRMRLAGADHRGGILGQRCSFQLRKAQRLALFDHEGPEMQAAAGVQFVRSMLLLGEACLAGVEPFEVQPEK